MVNSTHYRLTKDLYEMALETYFLENTIASVMRVLGVGRHVAGRIIKVGEKRFPALNDVIDDYDPANRRKTPVSNPEDKYLIDPKQAVRGDIGILMTYRKMVANFLKNKDGKLEKNSDGVLPGMIKANIRDIKEMIEVRRDLQKEERGNKLQVNLAFANLTDKEWDNMVTGKAKPKR